MRGVSSITKRLHCEARSLSLNRTAVSATQLSRAASADPGLRSDQAPGETLRIACNVGAAIVQMDGKLNLWMRSRKRSNRQSDRRRGTGYNTQPQDAGHSGLDCLNFSLERVMLGQDTFGPNDQAFALRSQTLKGMTTIDQRNIELLLQPADRSGEGGLGNVTYGRGTSEMSFPGHGDKIFELAKPHSRSFDLGDYCACTPR